MKQYEVVTFGSRTDEDDNMHLSTRTHGPFPRRRHARKWARLWRSKYLGPTQIRKITADNKSEAGLTDPH